MVTQGQECKGHAYVPGEVRGYYHDFRARFLGNRGVQLLDRNGIPFQRLMGGETVASPGLVAQYGLGAYDVYLKSGRQGAYAAFLHSADWLAREQDRLGGWDVWGLMKVPALVPYSAAVQGQGASLLYRAAQETGQAGYRYAADLAVECLLTRVEGGGPAQWGENRLVLEERVETIPGANFAGWIFGIFGLYDAVLSSGLRGWQEALRLTCETLKDDLKFYDSGFWSLYDRRGHVAGAQLHVQHIAMLDVLAELTGEETFTAVARRWERYRKSTVKYWRAFCLKAFQKSH